MSSLISIKRASRAVLASPPAGVTRGALHSFSADEVEDFEDHLEIPRFDAGLLRALFEEGLALGHLNKPEDGYALDRWLAPRLHSVLRIPRRFASDRAFWAWIAMRFAADYVHQRWENKGVVRDWRFTSTALRNGVSRLWWAAELLRNGPDYDAVDLGLRKVRLAQFALELRYSWYRPAAIAFVRVAQGGSEPMDDGAMRFLSTRANAYLPLSPLEVLGFDEDTQALDEAWWTSGTTLAELREPEPPPGPEDGYADPDAIANLEAWFAEVLEEADV